VNRETKLALILGLAVVLIVGVFMGEHFAKGRQPRPNMDVGIETAAAPLTQNSLPQNMPAPPPDELRVARASRPTASPTAIAASNAAAAASSAAASNVPPGIIEMGRPTLASNTTKPMPLTPGQLAVRSAGDQPGGGELPPGIAPTNLKPTNPQALNPQAPNPQPTDPRQSTANAPSGELFGESPAAAGPSNGATSPSGKPFSAGKEAGYVVKQGDTLSKIAKAMYNDGELHVRLADYNKQRLGKNGAISIGTTLRIPPKDVLLGRAELLPANRGVTPLSASGATPAGSLTFPSRSENAPGSAEARSYTVKSGDTLMTIARSELGSSNRWQEILDVNKQSLVKPEQLKIGMVLKLPARGAAPLRTGNNTAR